MITYYKKIDENTLKAIYEYETLQLEEFKKKFEIMYSNLAKTYGWNYRIHLYRFFFDKGTEFIGMMIQKESFLKN